MTDSILYMGVSITPDSEQRADSPGCWRPHATLRKAATGATMGTVIHDQQCTTAEEANAVALRLAKRRIRNELHQG